MKVTFLGGAGEIGASCALLELAESRLLIDCGQRLNAPPGHELPDFSLLEGGPPVAAVILTHAHADHIGALPALEPYLPSNCPILGTEPTLELARLMLQDTVRITTRFRVGDGQLPLFPAGLLPAVLRRFQAVRWGKVERLSGEVRATWFPAGHLLGAAMVEIRSGSESVLFSGDVSIVDQATTSGAFVPAIHPDILVLESTYGNRLHAHRPTQAQRIIERVRDCVAGGGRVLFPTFALGRAQEVLALLGDSLRNSGLPTFPVYADGLVRQVSRTYSTFASELGAACRRVWEQGYDPLFPEDLPILPVRDNAHREEVAAGGPCVVVASSGMLQGGASQFYARTWVDDPRNLILITGYQDEESPGEALLNLAAVPSAEPRYFRLGGVRTEVRCQVENFSLSAHADNLELVNLVDKLRPRLTLLVHGDAPAREMLSRGIAAAVRTQVVLPENGGTYGLYSLGSRKSQPIASRLNPLALWPPWDPLSPRALDLAQIHAWLTSLSARPSWITLDELSELWKSPDSVSADDRNVVREALATQSKPWFIPEARRPFVLRLTAPENLLVAGQAGGRLPVEQAGSLIRELLGNPRDLLRLGFFPDEGLAELEFRFPRAALQRLGDRLPDVMNRTGWTLRIHPFTREAVLLDELHRALGRRAVDAVLIHSSAQIRLGQALPGTRQDLELAHEFQQRTGYQLLGPADVAHDSLAAAEAGDT